MNAAAVRQAFEEGVARMVEQALVAGPPDFRLVESGLCRGPHRGALRYLRARD